LSGGALSTAARRTLVYTGMRGSALCLTNVARIFVFGVCARCVQVLRVQATMRAAARANQVIRGDLVRPGPRVAIVSFPAEWHRTWQKLMPGSLTVGQALRYFGCDAGVSLCAILPPCARLGGGGREQHPIWVVTDGDDGDDEWRRNVQQAYGLGQDLVVYERYKWQARQEEQYGNSQVLEIAWLREQIKVGRFAAGRVHYRCLDARYGECSSLESM
jgi:hypothetical protein